MAIYWILFSESCSRCIKIESSFSDCALQKRKVACSFYVLLNEIKKELGYKKRRISTVHRKLEITASVLHKNGCQQWKTRVSKWCCSSWSYLELGRGMQGASLHLRPQLKPGFRYEVCNSRIRKLSNRSFRCSSKRRFVLQHWYTARYYFPKYFN